jgi:hypothetical protein
MAQGMRKGKKLQRKGQLFLCNRRLLLKERPKRDFRLQVFYESVFPGPLSIPLRQFQILRINFVFIAGVFDNGEKLLPM